MTKRVLEQKGVPFTEVDIRDNSAARDYVVEDLGYTEAPVVVVSDEDHWSGFRPDQIDRLIKRGDRSSLRRPRFILTTSFASMLCWMHHENVLEMDPSSAQRLVSARNVLYLDPEEAVLDGMLNGWRSSRLLAF